MKSKKERRYDRYGAITLMAEADHYVMVRRKQGMPFILPSTTYRTLPQTTAGAQMWRCQMGVVQKMPEQIGADDDATEASRHQR